MIDVGLIGYGLAGASFHAPLIGAVPGLRLAGVVTSRAEAVARDWPQAKAVADAERTLLESYALEPANPITGFTLANLLRQRGEWQRAQFYIRRVNNGEFATAESLWLGIKIERRLGDQTAVRQLADQLRKRYPLSAERASFDRGAFDE